ncbi:TRAM domain-containing protein [Natrinema sp. H-ect4]|uniref:TRAM domain-containing protein n=1 Tax=Natrinema sp. H-ect4 TaxID=3242699 RepID=UPI0035A8822E
MDISEQLRCLFSARVEERDGSYRIEVPEQELQLGEIQENETFRVAILPSEDKRQNTGNTSERERRVSKLPVEEGDTRDVEIEDLGEQGDGIARVERGFVVIVPDTGLGERVSVEITDVRENVAFADVVDRLSYYD